MFRRMILTVATGVAVLAGLAAVPSKANAQPPIRVERAHLGVAVPTTGGYIGVDFGYPPGGRVSRYPGVGFPPGGGHHHHVHFDVLVRHRGHWDVRGTYNDRFHAERAARQLRLMGHDVIVRPHRD